MTIRELPPLNWIAERRLPGRVDWHAEVSAYVDGELSASDTARLEARLAQSPELRAHLEDLRAFDAMMRRTAARPAAANVPPTPAMLELAGRAPQSEFQARRRTPFLTPVTAGALSATVAAVFAALMVFDVLDPGTIQYSQTSASSVSQDTVSIPTREVVTQTREEPVAAQAEPESAAADQAEPEPAAADQAEPEPAIVASLQDEAEQQAGQAATEAAAPIRSNATDSAESASAEGTASAEPASEDPAGPVVAGDGESSSALTSGFASRDESAERSEAATADEITEPEEAETESAPMEADVQEEPAPDAGDRMAANEEDNDASTADSAAMETDDANRDETAEEAEELAEPETTTVREIEERDGEPTVVTVASEPEYPELERLLEYEMADPSWELPLQIALGALAAASALLWLLLEWRARRAV